MLVVRGPISGDWFPVEQSFAGDVRAMDLAAGNGVRCGVDPWLLTYIAGGKDCGGSRGHFMFP